MIPAPSLRHPNKRRKGNIIRFKPSQPLTSLSAMRLEATFRDDLLPVAATLAQEVELCCAMAKELQGKWNNETNQLLTFTLSSGIAQLLHLQRACQLEVLEAEYAANRLSLARVNP